MDFLRHLSRHSAPNLRIDVPPGARNGSGNRKPPGPSMDRRPSKCGRNVHGHNVDAAGMDARRMGAPGRRAGPVTIRAVQLLDERLLGRRRGCGRCGLGPWRTAANLGTSASPRRHYFWFGSGSSRDKPPPRRVHFLRSLWSRAAVVDSAAGSFRTPNIHEARALTACRNPGMCRGIHRVLQLARDRQPSSIPAFHRAAAVHHYAHLLVAARQTANSLCESAIRRFLPQLSAQPLSNKLGISRRSIRVEIHRFLAVLPRPGAFDSISCAAVAVERAEESIVAGSGCTLRTRSLGGCVLPRALRRAAHGDCRCTDDAGHAPPAPLAISRAGHWRGIDTYDCAVQFADWARLFRPYGDIRTKYRFRMVSPARRAFADGLGSRAGVTEAGIFARAAA